MAFTFGELYVGLLPNTPNASYVVGTVLTITQEDSRTGYASGVADLFRSQGASRKVVLDTADMSFSDRAGTSNRPFGGDSDRISMTITSPAQDTIRAAITLVTWSVEYVVDLRIASDHDRTGKLYIGRSPQTIGQGTGQALHCISFVSRRRILEGPPKRPSRDE
jgi:hypothetical protein